MSSGGFQQFQYEFARHLRDPHHTRRPHGVPARRMAVYSELLFNNVCGFLDTCFPISRQLIGESRWRRLNRCFYRDWPLTTPWFREIPGQFVRYLAEADLRQPLPAWFAELAQYEWVELAVDVLDCQVPLHNPAGDLLAWPVVLNPALKSLAYAWPVHRIGPDYRPRKPLASYLVVFRDADDHVRFSEINAITRRLLALLDGSSLSGAQAIARIADELQHPAPESLQAHGALLLDDLRQQGIILGTLA